MAGLEGPLGIVVICTLYKLLDGAKNKTLSALEHFVLDGQTDTQSDSLGSLTEPKIQGL